MILALSFVETQDVLLYASKLRSYFESEESYDVLRLFDWFEKEYLKDSTEGNKQISFWNVKFRTENKIPRTTNSLEGFYRHLNTFINVKQSNVNHILSELKNEQTVTENKIKYSLYKEKEAKQDTAKPLLEKYESYNEIEYLTHVALNFSWKLD